jgi:four helix bundle protein
MTYEKFEDLPVWNAAMDFAVRVFELVEDRRFTGCGDVRDQVQRASLSISNNIAEGFERGSTAELLMFLYIARGSAGESRSILRFCERLPRFAHLKSEISNLISQAVSISRQLRGWADSLQNSDIKGQRHLNEQSRLQYEQARRAAAFMAKLRDIREHGFDPEKHLPKDTEEV